ncbi:MAG: D-isomer specific 2-hydroxyacid dehydrogenase family protein [Acidimicrobiales bacterium]
MPAPRVAIGPKSSTFAEEAVRAAGGRPLRLGEPSDALVWLSVHDLDCLREVLDDQPGIRWVQLPFAGVEPAVEAGVVDSDRLWTCAKGSYAEPVAEHALTLALAGLRRLPDRIRAHSWGPAAGTTLHRARVTILGGGGITRELLRLLAPFDVEATVVRRQPTPVDGAARTVTIESLDRVLGGSLVVFVALALTAETIHVIGAHQLEAMGDQAWLVNVARGRHVHTDALVAALHQGTIAGAALDVTDPEPLPDGHPLWTAPNCIITPHTADTWEMILPLLAARLEANVAHVAAGEPLEGLVDPVSGY